MTKGSGIIVLALAWLALAVPALAQADPPRRPVTLDDVNAIARGMYCPECENIPLDKCGTPVCIQWKNEIADQLAMGMSADEIVDGFVARFGERVVSIPQDPTLRALSLIAPWVLAGLAAIAGLWVLVRVRRPSGTDSAPRPQPLATATDDPYRSQFERDLQG